jgi:hypothetical protein
MIFEYGVPLSFVGDCRNLSVATNHLPFLLSSFFSVISQAMCSLCWFGQLEIPWERHVNERVEAFGGSTPSLLSMVELLVFMSLADEMTTDLASQIHPMIGTIAFEQWHYIPARML